MQAVAIMYHDVVENGDFESSGFSGEGAHVYKLRREDFVRHLDAIARATAAVGTVRQLEGRPVLLTFDDGGVSFLHPIADLLESRGWRGPFFITTGPPRPPTRRAPRPAHLRRWRRQLPSPHRGPARKPRLARSFLHHHRPHRHTRILDRKSTRLNSSHLGI